MALFTAPRALICSKNAALWAGHAPAKPRLPAKHVIHTPGPIWRGGRSGETALLAASWRNSLHLAAENNCHSIAFPSISTGVFRFPIAEAAQIALGEIKEFAASPSALKSVIICCFSSKDQQVYQHALKAIAN